MKILKDKPYSRISIPPHTSGVYAIVNKFNDKKYIGSSDDCRGRIGTHLAFLRYDKHYNKHLQNAFNQCTIENFDYILLEEVEDLSKLHEREQYWMDYYQVYYPENGYNKAHCAESANRGLTGWNKDNWKTKVTEEQLIKEYKSGTLLVALSEKYHIGDSTISNILKANDIVPKITGRPKGRECPESIIDKLEKYYLRGYTVRQCAKKFKMPPTTVRQYLADRNCLRDNHYSPEREKVFNTIVLPMLKKGKSIKDCKEKSGIDCATIFRHLRLKGLFTGKRYNYSLVK